MLKKFVRLFGGDPNKRQVEAYGAVVEQINALESKFKKLSDQELGAITIEFRQRLGQGETLDDLLPEAYAVVREASKRTLGLRHYDVQMIGGIALHEGKVAEMRTGEGKTLVATLPLYLNALTGKGVHLITVNDYLARRDARWMAPIYSLLGLSIGVLQMASRTENGKKAFIVDLERESPHEDQHQLRLVPRAEAYAADITYGTNSEFGFDYLRDNMTMSLDARVQRGHYYAIIDEVDNVLIDEARTPLIISGPASEDTEWYLKMAQIVKRLHPEDFEIDVRGRSITLTEIGEAHVEELLEIPLRDPNRPEDVTPEQARLLGYLEQALRAQFLFKRNKDYLVQGGKVVIVDEFTGRLMPGRRWSDGLHQAVEAKEGVKVEAENVTYATITIQNYFRMYEKLAGMTGTAVTEAEEFDKIYSLEVLAIPTNLEYQAFQSDSDLVQLEDKDEQGYKFVYYAQKDDHERKPIFWKRKDYPDVIFLTEEAKFRAVTKDILASYVSGRPVLVGTTSVELSDRLSTRLRAEPLRRLAQVLLIRYAWFEKNDREEDGRQVKELQSLNVDLTDLQTHDLRKMAQSLEISFNPEAPENLARLMKILSLEDAEETRLADALKAGIAHEVLNARKHTEESQIIAGAGAFGAVTIATNMAGRGVDIKLGGEMAEEVITAVNRVLRRAGYENPYDMTLQERRDALEKMTPEDYGIYGAEVGYFFQQMDDMERVRELGGLHVVGSERHEARRIDNQLRGRSARQGDPGSSRFYLSLEDDLMKRFGGQQANDMMQRLKVDEAMPIEVGLVGRLVEQSQTRVEGANFDVRKHLLEYDDVLNTQRASIYNQRNRIFSKEDLSDDVREMLRAELLERVPKALEDEEGPWQLLAWLEQTQPPISVNGRVFPSFALRLLAEHIQEQVSDGDHQRLLRALLELAEDSLKAEEEHLLKAVYDVTEQMHDRLEMILNERREAIDTFFEGLSLADETDTRSPQELSNELSTLVRVSLQLSSNEQRALRNDPESIRDIIYNQIEDALTNQAVVRLLGSVERRLGEAIDRSDVRYPSNDWDTLTTMVMDATQELLVRRRERLLGTADLKNAGENLPEGQITREVRTALGKYDLPFSSQDKQVVHQALEEALSGVSGKLDGPEKQDIELAVGTALARTNGALSDEDHDLLLHKVSQALSELEDQPLGSARQEQVIKALEDGFEELDEQYDEQRLLRLLMLMPVGTQTSFDRKTHRRVRSRTVRLVYHYYAASLLGYQENNAIAADVLDHLREAQDVMRRAWGRSQWTRFANIRPVDLTEQGQNLIRKTLGEEPYQAIQGQEFQQMPVSLKDLIIEDLGRRALTEVYRQLLLRVITELWVEYLTEMEALRVSIGLEAYGQRDPLVQYKSKAFELFKNLMHNVRLGVITRMFTYRPRNLAALEEGGQVGEVEPVVELEASENIQPDGDASDGDADPQESHQVAVVDSPQAERGEKKPKQKMSKSQKRRRGRK